MNSKSQSRYFDQLHEKRLSDFEIELIAYCEVEGKHTGLKNIPKTEIEYAAYIVNQVEAKVQAELDFNNEHHIPFSGMLVAKQIKKNADEKVKPLEASVAEDEIKLRSLELKKKNHRINLFKKLMRKMVNGGIAVLSSADGY